MPFPAATPSPLATTDPPPPADHAPGLRRAADLLTERAAVRRSRARSLRIEADGQDRVAAALDMEAAWLRQMAGGLR